MLILFIFSLFLLHSCSTSPRSGPNLIVMPQQEAVYSGAPQPIIARSRPELPLVITYYNVLSPGSGSSEAPTMPGIYTVEVNFAPQTGFDNMRVVEYQIHRAPVTIIADEQQSASYDGNPKRVLAASEPELPLSYSYYPNPELLRAAVYTFNNPSEARQASLNAALRRFTRVERAPREQGLYYVLVFFPGNDRYEAAFRTVEFTIGPPVWRN